MNKSARAQSTVRSRRPRGLTQIPERLLARLWRERATRQEGFRTRAGSRLRVIYPGRPGNTAGPDFRNALLEVEGVGLVQGDVEIHIRPEDWVAHGHASDANYNGVVLHVALEEGEATTRLQSGLQAPVLSLAPLLEAEDSATIAPGPGLWALLERRGYPQPETAEEMGLLLDRAGDARFLGKSSRFQRFLEEQPPEETLYEGVLEALGYHQNQQPFVKLAGRAPYLALQRAAQAVPSGQWAQAIESWLLQLSGLLPPEEVAAFELPKGGFGLAMSGREWHCFRLRPANHPRRRIAGAARLLARFLEPGLVSGLGRIADSGNPRLLAAALPVAGDTGEGPAYVGSARARDLAVNVVLPFLHGLAELRRELQRAQTYLGLYHCFGKMQDNELTRETIGQLFPPGWRSVPSSAQRQQGLIHLHRLLTGAS